MTSEVKTKIEDELKRFATDLNLSEAQKTQLRTSLEKAEEKIEEIRRSTPDLTKPEAMKKLMGARDQIREHVVKFLNPEQLKKWDAEISKAKTFLGHRMAA